MLRCGSPPTQGAAARPNVSNRVHDVIASGIILAGLGGRARKSYERNPGFVSFIKSTGLPFKPYEEFKAKTITERGNLYRGIAKKVWDPDDLLATAEGCG